MQMFIKESFHCCIALPDFIQRRGSLGGSRLRQKFMSSQNKNETASLDLGLFDQTEQIKI